ncbi:hypothetical protein FQN54_003184 [Arachnomyces sp. PD_36]|nr:hypothetical protein FQN54_003184 [Arachnomyces sp. PD_36]
MIPKTLLSRLRPSSFIIPSRNALIPRRTITSTSLRLNAQQPPQQPQQPQHPQQPPQPPPSPSFKPFQRPFFKVFLGAIFIYQLWYWGWTKLETDELKAEKQEELSRLEKKARDLAASASGSSSSS